VKTKSRFSDRKDGSWTVTIRGAIARKYRSLREPVFLFAVDLQRNEIRWANMLAALQVAPRAEDLYAAPRSHSQTGHRVRVTFRGARRFR
jgi:hypothetical protein